MPGKSWTLTALSLGTAVLVLAHCAGKDAPQEAAKPAVPPAPQVRPPVTQGKPLRWFTKKELAAIAARDEFAALVPFELPLGLHDQAGAAFVDPARPITKEKVELGRLLYFDKRLSLDNTISCATCHDPRLGWSDEGPTSVGIGGQKGGRNAPTVMNTLFVQPQFWDGREPDLEGQAKGPITNPIEMGMPDHATAVKKIAAIKGYKQYFDAAYGKNAKVTIERIADAIAAFERTIVTGNSPFDRWKAGDASAMNESAIRGEKLFREKGRCTTCHVGAAFSDNAFHNLGVGCKDDTCTDWGRYEISKEESDRGAFKTPTLRNIAQNPPYMHDGSEVNLRTVVDLYNRGGNPNKWLSPLIIPLNLTGQEIDDIVAFMEALTGEITPVEEPARLPE
ncbi:MAG: c-type cytochrome [Deltaproteobacteria bacterium]|nr:c-type cytochrome [Deltaproteobacteria bacterium]